ncbi:YggT family protein [Candidatus Peregrinibacteria bacterium]|nr:YggT family protein [Candidatus Peregrinibacteria bacterium]MBI3816217.1 YggT family protein [Candidatus Peregrinibacteria bacterium]
MHFLPPIVIRVLSSLLRIFEGVLCARLVLKMFGLGGGNVIIAQIYHYTDRAVAPFNGIFLPSPVFSFFVDWATVLAIAAYGIVGYAVLRFLELFERPGMREIYISGDR